VERAESLADRRGAVDVRRRADRIGDLRQRHAVALQDLIGPDKRHRERLRYHLDAVFTSMAATPEAAGTAPQSIDHLIDPCLRGDQRAWDAIVRQHWRRVYNVAYKFVGRHEIAEDLAQDIFLKVFRSLGTFDRRANFQTWLVSVSRNLCIDYYRSVRK